MKRYWLAEHHNAAGLACSAPEVLIAAVAAATRTIRVGSGGIMLPNHSPLRIAEAFRVLSLLYPGRVDLGLGRAPGTDKKTALALRRHESLLGAETFSADLERLVGYLTHDPDPSAPFNDTKAVPTGAPAPETFLLGASVASGREAGARGLAFAYAHHFNPADAAAALAAYREAFAPSPLRRAPLALVATAAIAGASDTHAEELASSASLFWLRFGQGLRDLPLPSVAEARAYPYDDDERALAQGRRAFVGGPERVGDALRELVAHTRADELMVVTMVHDFDERIRSYERVVRAFA